MSDAVNHERTRFRAWITGRALTDGIKEVEVEDCSDVGPDMVIETSPYGPTYLAGDWHRTREEAVEAAKGMRARKITSLRKQIAKLERMEF